jgi:hypothetical protein
VGDTANPGTAETVDGLYRSLGQPQSKEDEVLSDGWPFRMPEKNKNSGRQSKWPW